MQHLLRYGEVSLSCHTCCDRGPWVLRFYQLEAPPYSVAIKLHVKRLSSGYKDQHRRNPRSITLRKMERGTKRRQPWVQTMKGQLKTKTSIFRQIWTILAATVLLLISINHPFFWPKKKPLQNLCIKTWAPNWRFLFVWFLCCFGFFVVVFTSH